MERVPQRVMKQRASDSDEEQKISLRGSLLSVTGVIFFKPVSLVECDKMVR